MVGRRAEGVGRGGDAPEHPFWAAQAAGRQGLCVSFSVFSVFMAAAVHGAGPNRTRLSK
jgi:hypothetical protein